MSEVKFLSLTGTVANIQSRCIFELIPSLSLDDSLTAKLTSHSAIGLREFIENSSGVRSQTSFFGKHLAISNKFVYFAHLDAIKMMNERLYEHTLGGEKKIYKF